MIGEVFGRLTVIERAGSSLAGEATYTCSCVCGTVVVVRGSHLRDGHIRSCGCLKRELDKQRSEQRVVDMTGDYISGWNVIRRDISRKYTQAHWVCLCAYCGRTQRVFSGWRLREGTIPDGCGCQGEDYL